MRTTLSIVFLAVAACGGSVAGSAVVDGSGAEAADAGGASDASRADVRSTPPSPPTKTDPPPQVNVSTCDVASVPSVQTVSFVVSNGTNVDQYVVKSGNLCDPYAITAAGSPLPLPLTLGFQCPCECPNPGASGPTELERIGPGESVTLTWDARVLDTCAETVDCVAMGWPGMGMAKQLVAGASPAASATYEAEVAFLDAVPGGCVARGGRTYSCNPLPSGLPLASTTNSLCRGTKTVKASFILGAEKTIDVPMKIQ